MIKFLLDSHTHTLASAHAYSTVLELAAEAAKIGLSLLAVTDHGPALPDSCDKWHFINYHVMDRELYGVKMLYGVELNILDYNGNIDLEEFLLEKQDLCIASFHSLITTPGSKKENTRAMVKAMENPYVDILGHPDDGNIPVDYEELVLWAKETSVLLEINNSSLKAAKYRLNSRENMAEMLKYCEKYGVSVSVGTDAHFASAVGKMGEAELLFQELCFPEELVVNSSVEKYLNHLHRFRQVGK